MKKSKLISDIDKQLLELKKITYNRHFKIQWKNKLCDICKWEWKITKQIKTSFGVTESLWKCNNCWWTWKIYAEPWKKLGNKWLEIRKETFGIKIPANIKDGAYIKFKGKGNMWIGDIPNGDLYIQIHVIPDWKDKDNRENRDNKKTRGEDKIVEITIEKQELWKNIEYKWDIVFFPKTAKVWDKFVIKWEWYSSDFWWVKWDLIYVIAEIIEDEKSGFWFEIWKRANK